jgi:hypothetical protein
VLTGPGRSKRLDSGFLADPRPACKRLGWEPA